MGSIDKSIFNYEFRVGVVNFGVGEFVSKSAKGVSEPVIFILEEKNSTVKIHIGIVTIYVENETIFESCLMK